MVYQQRKFLETEQHYEYVKKNKEKPSEQAKSFCKKETRPENEIII